MCPTQKVKNTYHTTTTDQMDYSVFRYPLIALSGDGPFLFLVCSKSLVTPLWHAIHNVRIFSSPHKPPPSSPPLYGLHPTARLRVCGRGFCECPGRSVFPSTRCGLRLNSKKQKNVPTALMLTQKPRWNYLRLFLGNGGKGIFNIGNRVFCIQYFIVFAPLWEIRLTMNIIA